MNLAEGQLVRPGELRGPGRLGEDGGPKLAQEGFDALVIGSQLNQSPLPLMEEVAQQGLLPIEQRAREELTVTGLNAGGLWEAIPRPEDLGEGFSVEDEFVPKMFGPMFGASGWDSASATAAPAMPRPQATP